MPGPEIWGPHGWKFIHYITLGYPNNPTQKDKQKYYDFFTSLSNVIPCPICGEHFKQHLEITPLDDNVLKDKNSLMAWAVAMHNHVNARNGKKIYSVKDAIKAIIENDDKCLTTYNEPEQFKETKTNNIEKFNNGSNNTQIIILSISICINILLILFLFIKPKLV